MLRRIFPIFFILIAPGISFASIEYDQNVTPNVIFGSNLENGGFAVDRASGLELGLRAARHSPTSPSEINSNGDGIYSHTAGSEAGQPLWSFDWSINTSWDGTTSLRFLRDLLYQLRIDTDPGSSTSFYTLDLINGANPNGTFWDHAIGDQFTAAGGGTVSADQSMYAGLIAGKNVAQNSWQLNAYPIAFNPNVAGIYTIELAAFPKSAPNSDPIAATRINVMVEISGETAESHAAPEPFSFATWGGLIGCAALALRRR